jgi:non-heme Fe2+,alpha-ketoglutarate-dependent halogenase
MANRRLSAEQKENFNDLGYITGLDVFDEAGVQKLNEGFEKLSTLLKPGEKHFAMNAWHQRSRWLYDVCTNSQILDYVEDLLGPSFYLWGSHFFTKAPGSMDTVAWHQDAPYWPLSPHDTATVWLAFNDVDEDNGAMKVIPRTHKQGLIKHKTSGDSNNVLGLELEDGSYNESDAVQLCLKAGQISIHDDALLHGSPANTSNRWRVGLTMRFSSTQVKCDLSKWPTFITYPVRGVDEFKYNPVGTVPTEEFARF